MSRDFIFAFLIIYLSIISIIWLYLGRIMISEVYISILLLAIIIKRYCEKLDYITYLLEELEDEITER